MARAPTMRDMQSRLDSIEREIEKLEAQKSLILDMMGVETESPPETTTAKRAKKGSVKKAVLMLLEEAGGRGLTANQAISSAKERGIDLDRGSVSSLLSRLKADNIVEYDDDKYRLKSAVQQSEKTTEVTPLRTSSRSVYG